MKILVTGGLGFIGSHLTDALVRSGHDVVVYDNLDEQIHPESRIPDYYNRAAELVIGDVRSYDRLRNAVLDGCEAIFHMAAAVGIGQSKYRIRHYTEVNEGGTANLLDILANHRHSVRKIVVSASMASYGEGAYRCAQHGAVRPPVRTEQQTAALDWDLHCPECGSICQPAAIAEDAIQNCSSVYAITKMNQEQLVLNVGATYHLPAVALRYFNVYGPRQSLSNPYTGVSAIFMSRIKNGNPPVIYEDGLQTRDFVSVHDVVRANMLALERDTADYEAVNIGSGAPGGIAWLAGKLAGMMGSDLEPRITGSYRKGDVRHCFADIRKAERLLGFVPRVPFGQGLAELIEWSKAAEARDSFHQAELELSSKGLIG